MYTVALILGVLFGLFGVAVALVYFLRNNGKGSEPQRSSEIIENTESEGFKEKGVPGLGLKKTTEITVSGKSEVSEPQNSNEITENTESEGFKEKGVPGPGLKKKKKRTDKNQRERKVAKEERRRLKEEDELERLREETRRFHEEQEAEKRRLQRLTEIKIFAKQKISDLVKEQHRESNLHRQQQYLEEEKKKKQKILEEEQKNKPKIKSAWGVPLGETTRPSLIDIQYETLQKEKQQTNSQSETDLQIEKYRTERRQRRKEIEQHFVRTQAHLNAYEERALLHKLEIDKKFNEMDKKMQSQIFSEKKRLLWKDTLLLKDENTVGKISGIPSDLHSIIVGEKGSNINLLRLLNVQVNVTFSDDPIVLRGSKNDILAAFEKIKLLLKWKYYKDEAKNQAEQRSKCVSEAATSWQHEKNLEKSKEQATQGAIHEHLITWATGEATKNCIKFHNDGFGQNHLDLRGLRDEDAVGFFIKRFHEIETIRNLMFHEVEIILGLGESYAVSVVLKEVVEYLREYHFKFRVDPGKGSIYVQV